MLDAKGKLDDLERAVKTLLEGPEDKWTYEPGGDDF